MDSMTLEEAKEELRSLEKDPTMKTVGRYSPAASKWKDSIKPFHEIHEDYLIKNKAVNPRDYLSNLRLMIKIRK